MTEEEKKCVLTNMGLEVIQMAGTLKGISTLIDHMPISLTATTISALRDAQSSLGKLSEAFRRESDNIQL